MDEQPASLTPQEDPGLEPLVSGELVLLQFPRGPFPHFADKNSEAPKETARPRSCDALATGPVSCLRGPETTRTVQIPARCSLPAAAPLCCSLRLNAAEFTRASGSRRERGWVPASGGPSKSRNLARASERSRRRTGMDEGKDLGLSRPKTQFQMPVTPGRT